MTTQETLSLHADSIIRDYQSGRSIKSIADELGFNSGTVWYFLDGRGLIVKRRSDHYGNSDQFLEAIRVGLAQDKSAYGISKELGVNKHLVLRVMDRHGLSTSHKSTARKNPLKHHDDEIVAMYESGATMSAIAVAFDTHVPSVLRTLRRKGIQSRPRAIYTQDEHFFDTIDTEVKAYLLGWWYSDGNNIKGGVGIRLQIADFDILQVIQRELRHTGVITSRPRRSERHQIIHCLQLNSKRLSAALSRLGCPPNKTFLLKFPTEYQVPRHLQSHFARGYFDGDGSIGLRGRCGRIQIVGTRHLLEGISRVSGVEGYWSQRHPERNNDNWSWSVHRKDNFPRLASWLYRDATIYLARKRQKYRDFIASQPVTETPTITDDSRASLAA